MSDADTKPKFAKIYGIVDPETEKVVSKLKYAAQKRPDLFGCWSAL
jgi:hypothetical protein